MPDPGDAVQVQLAKLKRKYAAALPERISGFRAAFSALWTGPWQEETCSAAYRLIHSLVGSSGTYGYEEMSGLAREAESLLRQSLESRRLPAGAQRARVEGLVERLGAMAMEAARESGA